jgi:hypothetical protein
MTGILLSNHSGPSADASGIIQLAIGSKVHSVYYDQSLQTHFGTESCADIGAIWTVEFHSLADSSLYADRAICDGKVNELVHNAWLLIREYLATMDVRPSAWPKLFSSEWISSPEGQEYELKAGQLDLTGYHSFGNKGLCIDVTERQLRVVRLEAGADCHLVLSGEPVDLVFSVAKQIEGKRWRIDRIETR